MLSLVDELGPWPPPYLVWVRFRRDRRGPRLLVALLEWAALVDGAALLDGAALPERAALL